MGPHFQFGRIPILELKRDEVNKKTAVSIRAEGDSGGPQMDAAPPNGVNMFSMLPWELPPFPLPRICWPTDSDRPRLDFVSFFGGLLHICI